MSAKNGGTRPSKKIVQRLELFYFLNDLFLALTVMIEFLAEAIERMGDEKR